MKKYVKISAVILSLALLVGCGAVILGDVNRIVAVNIINIQNDTEYLNNAYVDYDTDGKKVISCDILIKNNSFYNIHYSRLQSDDFDCILTGSHFEDLRLINIKKFHKQTIPCYILVDENLTEKDLLHILSNAYLEVMIDSDIKNYRDDFFKLKIDNVL